MTAEPECDAARARLWQLISPALPVGAYAYSQGLEFAVHAGWVRDEAGAGAWIRGHLHHGPALADVPVLGRCHEAWCAGDADSAHRWSRWLLANRGAAELLAEDRQIGASLARTLAVLGLDEAAAWVGSPDASFACLFALAAARWGIDPEAAATGYLWAWAQNQVSAAVKLVPLGQSAGQRLLFAIGNEVGAIARHGLVLDDEAMGACAPGVVTAAARHERQYSRLFRS
ncbi:urease accessory protein UreF [bacterium BMS3Bbin12]|nr:urease accessory protein UreF [bacterium BMS3Abin12]GBE47822.1 urease accessory protein UreF [bacterium BMS3Bbin12]GBE51069.1 urease accessory protein UreF [bacterium BMS3Bbin13]HDJ86106.1 urease accessory protein UreF [Chromatiales bacterium]HDK03631.1 urease accessory protein UreF [Gammaproteobacteria bacterium]